MPGMTSRPYVVLSGGYDTRNVGDYAMLDLFSAIARREGLDTRVLVRHSDEVLEYRYGASALIENFEYENRRQSAGRFFRGLNAGDDTTHLRNLRRELEGARGLYLGGGRLLIDHTLDVMRGPLSYFSTLVTLARFLDLPVHLYAMTIVPNRTAEGDRWLRYIVENCETISVRDPESIEHLHSIGCRAKNAHVLPDPAFALDWPRTPLRTGRVALSVRHIHSGWGGMEETEYLERMAAVVRLIQRRGFEVVGIPHQFYGIDNPAFDDRTILAKISERAPFGFIEDEWLDLDRYRDFYAGVDALVGIRRHSFLFAAAAGVPVLAFSENPNAARACRDFGGIAPIALDTSIAEFGSHFDRLIDGGESVSDRQSLAFGRAGAGLRERYRSTLFGSPAARSTFLACQDSGSPT